MKDDTQVVESENVKRSDCVNLICERCAEHTGVLFKYYCNARDDKTYLYEDDYTPFPEDDWVERWLCPKCANAVMNGQANKATPSRESNALLEATIAIFDVLIDTYVRYSSEGSIELKKHSANFVMTMRLERKEGKI